MNESCCFNKGHSCAILTEMNCRNCSFKASAKKVLSDRARAAVLLQRKGLRAVRKALKDGTVIMGTERIT